MKVRKIFCLVLCLIMLPLAGCRKINNEADTTASEVTAAASTAAETTDAAAADTPPETTAPVTAAPDTTAPETAGVSAPQNPVTQGGGDGTHSQAYSAQTPNSPSVLMYHLILDEPFTDLTSLFVRPSEFEDQLNALNGAGYEYMFADEYAYSSNKCVMLTFDDGYIDNYTEMYPLLKKYNAKATVFMIGYKVDKDGYLTSDMIREMAASGLVHFGSHTLNHCDLRSQSDDAVRDEFNGSRWILSQLTGQSVNAVCYPAGGVDGRVAGIAGEYFSYGYTTKSAAHTRDCDPLQIPRLRVSRGTSGNTLVSQLS